MEGTEVDLDLKTMQQVEACGFEPIQRKGQGRYGFVYEVGDAKGDLFAFKYILPDASYQEFGLNSLTEIDILSRVNHPHIIHAAKIITPQNCDIDGLAVILPLADRTLFDIIKDPMLTTEYKLPILYKLATALEFMHRSHILHLDIKSTNVVLQDIQENIPYFIDFGLSMIVDDVVLGKQDKSIRVTVDHRAPEILAGGRIYNAAVDVWAFGIMMLYVISGRGIFNIDFSTITDNQFHTILVQMFSTTDIYNRLLAGVRPKYRFLCIDFFTNVLNIDPTKRLTALEICNHPLFAEFKYPIEGTLFNPPIVHDYSADHRDILKLMIHWAKILYPRSRAEMLFLAVDLFNKISSFYKNRDALSRMSLSAACLWISAKLTNEKSIPLDIYVPELNKMVPSITSETILQNEIEIIHLSSGILDVSNLYSICTNGDELRLSFTSIVLDRDPTLYARTDIPAWSQLMKTYITEPIYPNKNITIDELIA